MTRAEGSSWPRPGRERRPAPSSALAGGAARARPAAARRRRETVVAYVEDHNSNELRLLVGEREVVVHDRDLVTRILNAAGGSDMSSHREAPEISKDPVADGTDIYAFVSPDKPDTVTLIANFIPLQKPDGGPNFYEFGDDVRYEIHIVQQGQRPSRTSSTGSSSRPGSATPRRSSTTPARSTTSATRPGTGRSSTRSPGSRTARRRCSARTCLPAGQRRQAQHAGLRDALGARRCTPLGAPQGLRGPACRRLPRRPRQHLRPRRAAPVQRGAPDLDAGDGRPSTRCSPTTCTRSRCRCRSRT